jgi:hypothetical protein
MNQETKLMAGMYVRIPENATYFSQCVSKNKEYQVLDVEILAKNTYFHIVEDSGNIVLCILDNCSFLKGGAWEIVESKKNPINIDKIVSNKQYQAALYFLAGIGFGYLIFAALS